MGKKAVKVVRDPEIIKILADPVRREILRFTSARPWTETQIARKLNLSKPSVGYHLQVLLKAGLIRVANVRVSQYGILEKYYEPTATLFLEDPDSVPSDLRRYFIHRYIERLRGMLSVFYALGCVGEDCEIDPEDLEELAKDLARHIVKIGEKYESVEVDVGRESLFIKVCGEALKSVMAEDKWGAFFKPIKVPLESAGSLSEAFSKP
jgi:DNA-binding transcriptional ArsR family regulator